MLYQAKNILVDLASSSWSKVYGLWPDIHTQRLLLYKYLKSPRIVSMGHESLKLRARWKRSINKFRKIFFTIQNWSPFSLDIVLSFYICEFSRVFNTLNTKSRLKQVLYYWNLKRDVSPPHKLPWFESL